MRIVMDPRRIIAVLLAIASIACFRVPPKVAPEPHVVLIEGREAEFLQTCTDVFVDELGRDRAQPWGPGDTGREACLDLARRGNTKEQLVAWAQASPEYSARQARLAREKEEAEARRRQEEIDAEERRRRDEAEAAERRKREEEERAKRGHRVGPVRKDGRAVADDGGSFNALGVSLFWALWGEANDPERLDRNMAAAVTDAGADYLRILGMVGASSWEDRRIDPAAPGYWQTVDRFLERAEKHRLRLHLTLFADAQVVMPDVAVRRAYLDRWIEVVGARAHLFLVVEIANESWQNGFEGDDGIAQLRELGRRFADRSDAIVALSSPEDGKACELYDGAGVDAATMHYDRDMRDRGYRPVRQPWGYPEEYEVVIGTHTPKCPGALPRFAFNSEPIGPQSSVAADDDPMRLVLGYVSTFIAQNAGYVLHTGAGIRGGGRADLDKGRSANLWEVPRWPEIARALKAAKAYLPPGLATWQRHNAQWPTHPFDGYAAAVDNGTIVRSNAATNGHEFIVTVFGIAGPVTARARQACVVDVLNPITGEIDRTVTLAAGDALTLEGREAFVLKGRFQ